MADNSNNRRKTLIVSVLAFLFIGGGVFLFFIVQGSNDLTGAGKKNSFTYGFAVREAVLPLFKRLGISTYDDEIVEATKKRLEARGVDLSPEPAGSADVSDWMADGGSGARSSPGSPSRAAPTVVPRMSGRSGSGLGGSGGSTQSSGGLSRFGDGSSAGNTTVSARAQAGAGGAGGKGAMGALKNARALLGEGLRSDSAMAAKSKWGQSFGVGGSGGRSGDLAYNKTGLVNLDKIKSGEIADLKMDSKGSLKMPEVSPMGKDEKGSAEAAANDKKSKAEEDAELKKTALQEALNAASNSMKPNSSGGDGVNAMGDGNQPPEEIEQLGSNSQPPDGKYCPAGCDMPEGGNYKDNPPEYRKEGHTWTVTYSGTQTNPDGTSFSYADTMVVVPGGNPPLVPLQSTANGKPVPFGGS